MVLLFTLYILFDYLLFKTDALKYIGDIYLKTRLLVRNNYLSYIKLNIFYNKTLYMSFMWVLLGIGIFIHYNYGSTLISNVYQWLSNNTGLLYISIIIWFFYILLGSVYSDFYYYFNLIDIRLSYTVLLLLAVLYFCVSSFFVVLFLIECLGVVIIYLLFAGHKYLEVYKAFFVSNIYYYFRTRGSSQFIAIFIQFFISFIAAVLFIVISWKTTNVYGVAAWIDILVLSFFNILNMYILSDYGFNIIILLLLLTMSIKLGLFPFHFWKPILYRGISLCSMVLYMIFITVIFILLFSLIYICVFAIINLYWYVLIYFLIIAGICVLLNMMTFISEFRIFLSYMSVFHMTYILCFFLLETDNIFSPLLNYIYIYIVLLLLLFSILIVFRNLDIKFLTDFQKLFYIKSWSFVVFVTLVFMSGLPPFIGFWGKISLMTCLLSINEFFLMALILGSGFILMYFYLQIYRFFSVVKFSWDINSLYIWDEVYIIYVFVYIYILTSIIQPYVLNDLLDVWGTLNLLMLCYDHL